MNKFIKRILLLSLIFTIGSLAMVSTASAATITAGMNSTEIQNEINLANENDVISFEYYDYQNISLVINKSLNLQGNGAILNYDVNNLVVLNVVNTDNVIIDGFTINGGRAIVANNVSNLIITNNVINMQTNNDAISLTSVQKAILDNNKLYGDNIGRDGIGLVNSSDITISTNEIVEFTRNGIGMAAGRLGELNETRTFNIVIQGNDISFIGEEGIYFGGGVDHVNITNNNIFFIGNESNGTGNGINIARSSEDILITDNTIEFCGVGIRVEEGNTDHDNETPTVLKNVIIENNTLNGNSVGILLVNSNNPVVWTYYLLGNNDFSDNGVDVKAVIEVVAELEDEPVDDPITNPNQGGNNQGGNGQGGNNQGGNGQG